MNWGGPVSGPGFRTPPPAAVVTGASGWLGRTLVEALANRGSSVRCLVRTPLEASELELLSPQVTAHAGDVRNPADADRLFESLTGPSVFHAAAVIHPQAGVREFFDTNVGGTALVLDRARRCRAVRFVHVSSNSPFGEHRDPEAIMDEEAPYRPTSGYGRSKMEAEILVDRASRAGDLETVIVRCPWFYGPGQPARQTRFMTMVRRGLFPLVGDGGNRRSLAYTGALAEGLVRAELCEGAAGRAYWLADARPYSMREIVQTVKEALAAEGLTVASRQPRLPGALAEIAGAVDRGLQRFGRYSQEAHVLSEMNKTIACSVERAERELGYRAPDSLLPGMRESVRWCMQTGEPL